MASSYCCQSCYTPSPILPKKDSANRLPGFFQEGMLLPPDPLNLLEVPVWRWSWILGFSLALCLQTDAGGSGCLGSLSGALLGSPDRGLLWVPRGQNRCCPPLTGQGSELSWLTELAGTCLYSLMQADLRVSHFNCYSGLGKKKKKGNAWKKEMQVPISGKRSVVSSALKKMPEKLSSFPCFLCFLKGQVPLYSYYLPFLQILQR